MKSAPTPFILQPHFTTNLNDVIGGDVACLMPTKDSPNQITSLVTMSIMFEIISLIADGY